MVTSPPESAKPASRAGMAVISLDLLSTASCPSTSRCSTFPRTHQVQRRLFSLAVEGMADRLSIDGHMAYLTSSQPVSHPMAKTLLKLVGIEQHEHPTKGVMRGDAILQRQEASQPTFLALGIQHNVFPALSTGNHSTGGHEQNLEQVVLHFVCASRVVYLRKGIDELFEQDGSSDHNGMATLL